MNARTDTSLAQLVLQWSEQPGIADFWAKEAAAVSRGEITVFGHPWSTTPQGIPVWDVDALTSFQWPQDYCFDVALAPSAARPVEVKYVWELNRLLYLLPVAAHAATRSDHRVDQLCRDHLESWIHTHPPRRGVTWRSGIELAHRILVFVLVLEMCNSGSGSDPALEELVGRAVADHADWIRRFPSRYSSANNHRVTELVGLLIAAAAYPQLASSDEVAIWWLELDAIVQLQFHTDGVPAEQATMYAFQVLEWVSIGLRLESGEGRQLSAETRERVRSATSFLSAITDASENAVRIGDDDDSRLLTAALPHGAVTGAVLALVSDELGVPVPVRRTGLSTFADGGYTVWRSGSGADEILWVLDHGPLGMGYLAAHAHADTLAVFLHVGGRPVLIDAGTYLYHSGGAWRDQLRRTAEHNTVSVGGQDSSVMAGPFSWRRQPRAEGRLACATSTSAGWSVEAEHHGYTKRFGIVHRRVLEGLEPGSFQLTDHLEGGTSVLAFRWSLLIAPGLDVVRTTDGWLLRGEGTELALTVPPEWRAYCQTEIASYSPAFGQLEETSRLVLTGDVDGRTSIRVGISVVST